jgi:uncharacterized protein DUF6941
MPDATLPPHPVLRAMLTCDYTIRDAATGKVSLIGIFEAIQASDFPVLHPTLCVYVNMSDLAGQYSLRLEFLRVEDNVALGRGDMTVAFADRMRPAEVIFDFRNLAFERAGRYEFRLTANDRYVGSKLFDVVRATAGPGAA